MGVSSNSCLNVLLVSGANRDLVRKLAKYNMCCTLYISDSLYINI